MKQKLTELKKKKDKSMISTGNFNIPSVPYIRSKQNFDMAMKKIQPQNKKYLIKSQV